MGACLESLGPSYHAVDQGCQGSNSAFSSLWPADLDLEERELDIPLFPPEEVDFAVLFFHPVLHYSSLDHVRA